MASYQFLYIFSKFIQMSNQQQAHSVDPTVVMQG